MLATNLKIKIHSTSKNQSRDHEHASGSRRGPSVSWHREWRLRGGSGQETSRQTSRQSTREAMRAWSRAVRSRQEEGVNKYLQGKLGCEEGDSVVTGSFWIWWLHVWWRHRVKMHQRQDRAPLQRMLGRLKGSRVGGLMLTASPCPVSEVDSDWGSQRSLCQEDSGHYTSFRPLVLCQACGPRSPRENSFHFPFKHPPPCQEQSVFCHGDPLVHLLCVLLTQT